MKLVLKHTPGLCLENESYLYEGCKGCHYIDVCQSGCRMHGMAATGKMTERPCLVKNLSLKYKLEYDTQIESKIKSGAFMYVPESICLDMKKTTILFNEY